MKISMLLTGKTDVPYISEGLQDYFLRIKRYVNFEIVSIPEIKNAKSLTPEQYKQKEAEQQLKHLANADFVVLLDEFGKELGSVELARFIENKMQQSVKNLMFVVGGPFGFSEAVMTKSNYKLSLSKLTFPHQLVRLIFAEQLYRAFTIIKNEKYHHP